jgi:hypothetical protein
MLVRPRHRRAFGWILFLGGAIGLVACLVGTIVAWFALGSARRSTIDGLDVTEEALVAVEGSLTLAGDVIGSVRDGMQVVEDALVSVSESVGAGDTVLSELDTLASRLPASIDTTRTTLRSLGEVAAVVDQTLAAAALLPFVPGGEPPKLADAISRLDGNLAPIQDALTQLDRRLDVLTAPGAGLSGNVATLAARVSDLNDQLATADAQVDRYLATADRAQGVIDDARDDLDRDLTALRWLAVPVGLSLAIATLGPLWLGGGRLGRWPVVLPDVREGRRAATGDVDVDQTSVAR